MAARISVLLFLCISLLSNTSNAGRVAAASPGSSSLDAQNIRFVEVISGLSQPLFVTNAGDGSGRLFIVQRAGQILIYKNGSVLPAPFLDIQSIVNSTGSEQGLLGLAFHPAYETNGRFYTIHTDQNRSIVLSVFTRSGTNPDRADPNSRVTLLTIPKTYTNHNGGTLAFGPDGYLYWSTGDGGGAGDPDNNAQSITSLLGKILRLDVSQAASYSIPTGNPFYNNTNPSVRKEIWAYGLRNPWRISFDRLTGDLYIGDVGQGRREEIDFQPAGSAGGQNYGWRVMEGTLCYSPSSGCSQLGKVLPVAEYDHSLGCSVTGGYVYRGTKYPGINGYYFYGDFCSGLIYALRYDSSNGWISQLVADTPYAISTFGEDEQGELYLADYSTGRIYQIAHTLPPGKAALISPSGTITNTQPTFSWNEVAGDSQSGAATWYYLWINNSSAKVFAEWYRASEICTGGLCSVTPSITLQAGAHRWWVQTWNAGGYGPWSDGLSFDLPVPVPPSAATLVSPSGSLEGNNPAYTWNRVSEATWYYLYVSGPSNFVFTRWYRSTDVCGAGTCSISNATPGLAAGQYRWWIQTWNHTGGYGPWSSGMNFSVPVIKPPVAATLISPSGNITNTRPAYSWNAVTDSAQGSAATWYYLWVSDASGNVFRQWYQAPAVCSSGTCSVTPDLVLAPGAYTWWVRTWNPAGHGPWSSALSFTVAP